MSLPVSFNRAWRGALFGMMALSAFVEAASADQYSADAYCDYYDASAGFMLSFDKGIALGRSAPSSSQGIGFLFDDDASLRIFASFSGYEPDAPKPNPPDVVRFVKDHRRKGCAVLPARFGGKRVRCAQYDYSIIPINRTAQPYADLNLFIMYNFTTDTHHRRYEDIVGSLVIFFSDSALHRFYDITRNIAYEFDPDDPFRQPPHVCGAARIRQQMLEHSAPQRQGHE